MPRYPQNTDYKKPMLASRASEAQIKNLLKNKGTLEASPKLDGIRCMIQDGVVLSRALKPIRNKHVQDVLGLQRFNGLDGELIIGEPTDKDVYRNTVSGIMREEGEPDFTFWIFDDFSTDFGYTDRREALNEWLTNQSAYDKIMEHSKIKMLEHTLVNNMIEVAIYEGQCLKQGYEGIILRDPHAAYKHGRATAKEGELIKVKRFEDGEAIIISMEEQLHNGNEAKTNELGRTQRSSHKENKIPMGTLGALVVKDTKTGIEFNIGTGFTDEIRHQLWTDALNTIGKTIKYKSFKIGVKTAPRHPVYLGMRDSWDIS